MADLLVKDVPVAVVEALHRRAAESGRTAEDEHRRILEEALRVSVAAFRERAARLREETRGRVFTDAADLIREGPENR